MTRPCQVHRSRRKLHQHTLETITPPMRITVLSVSCLDRVFLLPKHDNMRIPAISSLVLALCHAVLSLMMTRCAGADRGAPYQPSTSPGGRLPHCNLELLEPPLKYVAKPGDVFFLDQLRRVAAEYKRGSTMSSGVSAISAPSRATKRSSGNPKKPAATPSETTTVDAVSACGGRPLLILGEGGAAADWLAAAVLLRREGFETQVLQVIPPHITMPLLLLLYIISASFDCVVSEHLRHMWQVPDNILSSHH